jgi:hypothetical protein
LFGNITGASWEDPLPVSTSDALCTKRALIATRMAMYTLRTFCIPTTLILEIQARNEFYGKTPSRLRTGFRNPTLHHSKQASLSTDCGILRGLYRMILQVPQAISKNAAIR